MENHWKIFWLQFQEESSELSCIWHAKYLGILYPSLLFTCKLLCFPLPEVEGSGARYFQQDRQCVGGFCSPNFSFHWALWNPIYMSFIRLQYLQRPRAFKNIECFFLHKILTKLHAKYRRNRRNHEGGLHSGMCHYDCYLCGCCCCTANILMIYGLINYCDVRGAVRSSAAVHTGSPLSFLSWRRVMFTGYRNYKF